MKLVSMKCCKFIVFTVLIIMTSACGNKSMYNWGGYSNNLLGYYKNMDDEQLQKFSDSLYEGIEKAEIKDNVPPGMYAEYGYTKLELNDANTAAIYFQKEWDKWPESRFLMEKVMKRLTTMAPEQTTPSTTGEM
ncbi:MAG: DUF4810 domain-containing protein [Kordiimonadaceae bacterium]|nr:DUF4810 domain-containing protein [Kordiimonadaceae bacterium]